MTISVTTIPPDCNRRVLLFLITSMIWYFYHQNAIVYHVRAICLSSFVQFTFIFCGTQGNVYSSTILKFPVGNFRWSGQWLGGKRWICDAQARLADRRRTECTSEGA